MEPSSEPPSFAPPATGDDSSHAEEAAGPELKVADLLSDLLSEMKENNRLLRALAARQNEADGVISATALPPIQRLEIGNPVQVEGQSETPAAPTPTARLDEEEKRIKEVLTGLIDQYTKAVVNLDEQRAASLCHTLFAHFYRPFTWDLNPQQRRSEVSVWFKEKGDTGLTRLLWKPNRYAADHLGRHRITYGDQWNLEPAARMVTEGWLIRVPEDVRFSWMPIYGTALCCCGLDGGAVHPAAVAFRLLKQEYAANGSTLTSDVASPGSFWVFPTRTREPGHIPRHMGLGYVSLICTAMVAMGMNDLLAIRFLRSFFEGLPVSPRQPLSSSLGQATTEQCYLHHVRFFAPSGPEYADGSISDPGVTYQRVDGFLESLGAEFHRFEEHRITIVCSAPLSQDSSTANKNAHRLFMMVLEDISTGEVTDRPIDFLNWKDRGFSVVGANAAHHLLQATLQAALGGWSENWSKALDALDSLVSTEVEDIMSQQTSERLMFDGGFQRSGVYFKTLQILRIFAQMIQRTRKEVELLNPQASLSPHVLPLTGPGSDPTTDDTLMTNWTILWAFYLQKEDYLLKRIADKTEEVKSLRDGLFNATSLREASRSTTMNRYVIVFTIMTVLYLPPSLVATVFGTQLFDSGDAVETVTRFKISMVVTSISTYILGVFLIWLADRLDLPGFLLHRVTDWCRRTFIRATSWYGSKSWKEEILAAQKKKEGVGSSA